MALGLLVAGVSNTVLRAHGSFSEMSPHKWHHYFGKVNYSGGQAGFDRLAGTQPDAARLLNATKTDHRIERYTRRRRNVVTPMSEMRKSPSMTRTETRRATAFT
eukprot:CAMPEP_0170146534 /NCGR_PEP_ID=MMETSP0033_2-20121228/30753_1 /TAXON_ID=195969 /ORGANISM="Dolichomastix tenuilepis, Strain CCMP3274" /LENGTH=103 /DNA_ID=CAMNT_0010383273 /DNA_START=461 /DNA_END=769 /DNA_ORIENTATION=+